MIFLPSIEITDDIQAAIEGGTFRVQTGQWVHCWDKRGKLRGRVVIRNGRGQIIVWDRSEAFAAFHKLFCSVITHDKKRARRWFRPISQRPVQLDMFPRKLGEVEKEMMDREPVISLYHSYRVYRKYLHHFAVNDVLKIQIEKMCTGWRFAKRSRMPLNRPTIYDAVGMIH